MTVRDRWIRYEGYEDIKANGIGSKKAAGVTMVGAVGGTSCCPISIQGRGHEREERAFFGEFDRQVRTGYGKVFKADAGGKVGRSNKEEVEEFVEQFLGLVHITGEVFRTGELTNVMADGSYNCYSP